MEAALSSSAEWPELPPARPEPTEQERALARIVGAPLRVDLIFRRQFFKNDEYYVIKDPLALTYFRLQPEEAYIATLLNGKRTVGEIAERLLARFPNSDRTVVEIAGFINQLAVGGLLNISANRFVENARRTVAANFLLLWAKVISSLLFFKIPLVDPSPWLGRLTHAIRFVWTKWFVGGALVLFVWTIGLLIYNHDAFTTQRIDFFSSSNLLLVWLVIIGIKTVHEFGHATTCRHFGGEVHEMGVCLMCFTPCGYVDASDAWMMRHKRHKVYTTLAGVFIELVIACIAAHLWLVLHDGLARNLAFNAMIVASVNTLVFNANPLMRFDGYYVVSDLFEIPNLRSKAISYCSFHLQRIFLGYRNRQQEVMFEQDAHGRVFVVYAVLAYIYMIFIIYGLTQIFARVLRPAGLESFGLLLGLFVEGSFVAFPFIKVFLDSIRPEAHIEKVGSPLRRLSLLFAGLAALGVASFFIPTHFSVTQQAAVLADRGESASSSVGGVVRTIHVHTGDWVEPGTLLVTLENPEISSLLAMREADLASARLNYRMLQEHGSWAAGEQMASAAQALEVAEAGYARARADAEQLEIRAKSAGFVLTPDVQRLTGAYFSPQQPIVRVGDLRNLRLLIPLSEDQAQLVEPGSPVTGRWRGTAEPFQAELRTVSSRPAASGEITAAMLSFFGGPAPAQAIQSGAEGRSQYPIFIATALLPAPEHLIVEGLRVEVTIEGRRTTLAKRCWRWLLSLWNVKAQPA